MWKLAFLAVALCFSVSPLDAASRDDGTRIDKTQRRDDVRREDLRRDVERISREIYRRSDQKPQRR